MFYSYLFQNPELRNALAILRGFLLTPAFKECGEGLRVEDHFRALGIKNISVGKNVYINHHVELIADHSSITIGDDVALGHSVRILTLIHQYKDRKTPILKQP